MTYPATGPQPPRDALASKLQRTERAATTLAMLAECLEVLGGVPGKVLADRMGCLKGGVVANKVVPTAEYVRFATHSLLTERAD